MNAVVSFRPATPVTLSQACAELDAAKLTEHEATLARLAAEIAVLALTGELNPEGTQKFEDGGGWIATIQTSVRRAVDADKLAAIATKIPEAIGKRLIRWKPELDTRELRYVQANEPELYAIVATAIEAKPAKPQVKVERVKEGK